MMIFYSGSQYVRHPTKGQFLSCVSERVAIIKFLRLLETAKNRTMPAYDGVIFASHSIDTVRNFIKIVKRRDTPSTTISSSWSPESSGSPRSSEVVTMTRELMRGCWRLNTRLSWSRGYSPGLDRP